MQYNRVFVYIAFLTGKQFCKWLFFQSLWQSLSISHLLFADGLMVFGKANAKEASSILSCLNKHSLLSCQQVNFENSVILFSKNTKPIAQAEITPILGLKLIPPKAKYLGIPSFIPKKNQKIP